MKRFILTLGFGFLSIISSSQGAPDVYPGSETSLSEAVSKANLVAIGKIVEIGEFPLAKGGAPKYNGVKIHIERILVGVANRDIKVHLWVIAGLINEHKPAPGEKYILFVQTAGHPEAEVLKMLPVDDATIASVTQLIASKNQSK